MTLDRSRVRALVRRELERRFADAGPAEEHAALGEIVELPAEPTGAEGGRRCVIEPERPCTLTGYCKKLGY